MEKQMKFAIAVLAALAWGPEALAHSPADHAHSHGAQETHHGENIEGGLPGKVAEISRTVTIVAKDTEFSPKSVTIKEGETIRIVVRNEGQLVHELTIGSNTMQIAHQEEMLGFAASGAITVDRVDHAKIGKHGHGNNVLLEPGKSGEVIWKFAKSVDLEFGCNIPGHYDQGMKGAFTFQ
jgi:uncharacterized cupredoxin-like copper-binding protein